MAAGQAPPRESGNTLTRKAGPLPVWGWLLVVTAVFGVWYLYNRKKTPAAATAATAAGQTAAANVPDYVFQNYNQIPPTTPAPVPPPSGTPAPAPEPYPKPGPPGPLVKYLPGGYPGGIGAAGGVQTQGTAYNFSAPQLQQLKFPNLRGMTLAQAQQALQSYAGGAYKINNVSGNQGGKIVSFTPYSTGQVNVGLS